jgi:hypothetical protein
VRHLLSTTELLVGRVLTGAGRTIVRHDDGSD